MEDNPIEFRIAVVATGVGFKDFIRDIYFDISDNIYKINFIEVNMSEKLRGNFFNASIIHYSSRDIDVNEYKRILKYLSTRTIKIR